MTALIVFSHLRWGFVYQRPQHLMTALAEQMPILFVEEPVHTAGAPHLECRTLGPNLQVLVPHTPLRGMGFHDEQMPLLRRLLDKHLHLSGLSDFGVWFCTPMALPLTAHWKPRVVVYDCMDEHAALQSAPPLLQQREAALLKRADLVLTSGPSLYEAERALHANVHYLPSTVDAEHFAPCLQPVPDAEAAEAARRMHRIARPRLGYFGLIDERIDFELLDAVAAVRPLWQLVMVGPIVRVDRRLVPRRPNIHWLGQQPYQRLPRLLALWDVALMPFALNDGTRCVNPSKALEYMAGEKPVVSTPLPDVVSLYGDLMRIARRPREFVDACAAALAETPWQRSERLVRAASTVYRTSWKAHARLVLGLLSAPRAGLARPAPRGGSSKVAEPHLLESEHLTRDDSVGRVPELAVLPAPALHRLGHLMAAPLAVVTGGAGFIGSHLCDRLLDAGWRVLALDDFSSGSPQNVQHLESHPRFELMLADVTQPLPAQVAEGERLYNLACPASPAHYQRTPVQTTLTSVLSAWQLLALAERSGARVFQASTSEVYGDPLEHPQAESYRGHVNPIGPRACYDEGKRCAETLCFAYHLERKVAVRIARLFNTYGPRLRPGDGRVVSNFIVQALRGEALTVYGTGQQTRSFCYIDDTIEAMWRLMDGAVEGPLNIGSPQEHTVLELADLVLRLTGSRSRIQHCALPADDPHRRCPDISRMRSHFGWEPRVSLEDGLRKTIDYFQSELVAA